MDSKDQEKNSSQLEKTGICVRLYPTPAEVDEMIESYVQKGWTRDDCKTGRGVLSPDGTFWRGWDENGHGYCIDMNWIVNLKTAKESDCG